MKSTLREFIGVAGMVAATLNGCDNGRAQHERVDQQLTTAEHVLGVMADHHSGVAKCDYLQGNALPPQCGQITAGENPKVGIYKIQLEKNPETGRDEVQTNEQLSCANNGSDCSYTLEHNDVGVPSKEEDEYRVRVNLNGSITVSIWSTATASNGHFHQSDHKILIATADGICTVDEVAATGTNKERCEKAAGKAVEVNKAIVKSIQAAANNAKRKHKAR